MPEQYLQEISAAHKKLNSLLIGAYLEKLIAENKRLADELLMIKNALDNDWQLIAKGFETDRTEIMRKVATDWPKS